jgi:prepilin-type N-terminal cleavage/methylation domain-containing protein
MRTRHVLYGYTLVELTLVIVVISILATISVMGHSALSERARGREAVMVLERAYAGFQRMRVEGLMPTACPAGSTALLNWTAFQMADPGTAPGTRFFTYTISGVTGCGSHRFVNATRIGNASRFISIDLFDATMAKSIDY